MTRVLGLFQAFRNLKISLKSKLRIFPILKKMREKLQKYFNSSVIKKNLIRSNPSITLGAMNFQTGNVFLAHQVWQNYHTMAKQTLQFCVRTKFTFYSNIQIYNVFYILLYLSNHYTTLQVRYHG